MRSERAHLPPIVAALVAAVLFLTPSLLRAEESPWELLEGLRQQLEAGGPVTGKFVQTYLPAGFTEGEQESGHLSLWLPKCLRWNYEEPQAKSFLLCGDEVYYWNEEEPGGRHYQIEPAQEPGLDLLLASVADLRQRYVADSRKLEDGTYEIALATPAQAERTFRAKIHLDPVAHRVVGMEYTDEEGNLTRFAVTDYQPLSHTALFQPPEGIEWSEE